MESDNTNFIKTIKRFFIMTLAALIVIGGAAVTKNQNIVMEDGLPQERAGMDSYQEEAERFAAAVPAVQQSEVFEAVTAAYVPIEVETVMSAAPYTGIYKNQAVANVNESLNMRKEPASEGEIIGKLYKGAGGEILAEEEGWVKVLSGDLEGWVSADYLVIGQDIEIYAKEHGFMKAEVATDTLKVRKEADGEAEVLGLIGEGEKYPVLEEASEWVKIQYSEDLEGYVSADYVDVDIKIGQALTLEEERAAQAAAASKAAAEKIKNSISQEEMDILLACVMMEAGGYSYDGQLAVANVILNRVKSGRWGNSVASVVYAKGQFPGAASGLLSSYMAKGPSSTCVKAVNDALAGVNNIGDYLFFCSSKTANYGAFSQYEVVGGNCFYKK